MHDQHEPIAHTYACQRCGRRDGLDSTLPSEIWAQITNGTLKPSGEVVDGTWSLLCLWCIDELCKASNITCSVSLHFAGKAIHGTSDSDANAEHVSALVKDRADLEHALKAAGAGYGHLWALAGDVILYWYAGGMGTLIDEARAAQDKTARELGLIPLDALDKSTSSDPRDRLDVAILRLQEAVDAVTVMKKG